MWRCHHHSSVIVSTIGGGISHVCQGHMILACNVSAYGVVIMILVCDVSGMCGGISQV